MDGCSWLPQAGAKNMTQAPWQTCEERTRTWAGVRLLKATWPANMSSAATQLYSGFIFFSGEFVV